MKTVLKICLVFLVAFAACKDANTEKKVEEKAVATINYQSFGADITAENSIDSKAMLEKFNSLKVGDTLAVKFSAKISEVCSKKGCWMKLDLTGGKQSMVRFKDYGFFMPLDAKDNEVIVNGKAFIKETSVDELRHYAEDAGKSKEEIAKITEPKRTLSFEADGVLMKK